MKTVTHPVVLALFCAFIFTAFLNKPIAPAGAFKVDAQRSKIVWRGYYVFSFDEHHGTIDVSNGEILVDDNGIIGGFFDIDMKTITNLDMPKDEGGEDLVNHLKSDDFFSVDKFPVARFRITKVEKIKDALPGKPNYDVTGLLTIKDVANAVSFPVLLTVEENTLVASARFKFDRTQWNIRYNSGRFFDTIGDGAISDGVGIEINLIATR